MTYELSNRLIAVAREHSSVQALVYTCTTEAVNMRPEYNSQPLREDQVGLHGLQLGPNAYSRTKAAVDALIFGNNTPEVHSTTGTFEDRLLLCSLRVAGLYGPRDRLTIVEMLTLVNTPRYRYQIGPNRLVHDWIHVENCVRARLLAAKAFMETG